MDFDWKLLFILALIIVAVAFFIKFFSLLSDPDNIIEATIYMTLVVACGVGIVYIYSKK